MVADSFSRWVLAGCLGGGCCAWQGGAGSCCWLAWSRGRAGQAAPACPTAAARTAPRTATHPRTHQPATSTSCSAGAWPRPPPSRSSQVRALRASGASALPADSGTLCYRPASAHTPHPCSCRRPELAAGGGAAGGPAAQAGAGRRAHAAGGDAGRAAAHVQVCGVWRHGLGGGPACAPAAGRQAGRQAFPGSLPNTRAAAAAAAAPPRRLGTSTADVPAKVGDRVTVVCAPQRPLFAQRRLLAAVPHGAKPGAGWGAA